VVLALVVEEEEEVVVVVVGEVEVLLQLLLHIHQLLQLHHLHRPC